MSNAYQKSIELELEGTDQEQVTVLKSLTSRPISTDDLANLMLNEDLLYVGKNNVTMGELAAVDHPMLHKLYTALFTPRASKTISTHEPKWGVNFKLTIDNLLSLGKITQEQHDGVLALGGGLAYPDLTLVEFANQRNEAAVAQEAADVLVAQESALMAIQDKTVAVAEAAAEAYRAGLTPEEITAAGNAAWVV